MDEQKVPLSQDCCDHSDAVIDSKAELVESPVTVSPIGEGLTNGPASEPQPPVTEAPPVGDNPSKEKSDEGDMPCQPIGSAGGGTAPALVADLAGIKTAVATIATEAKRSSAEIHEMHRLYHNEFAGRLKSMQDELDRYHDADKGRAFDGILAAIARIYGNNESLVDEIADPKINKHVQYFLLDLSDLLEEYGVQKLKSSVGDKRNIRHCQILERIPTDDPALHDTIVASHNTGFHKDNRTIIKELVDVYFYDKSAKQAETLDEPDSANSADIEQPAD